MDLLRHLRIFVAVAEELHFGRAAERLGTAQPPVSRAVRGLEKELGTELFDRSRRRTALTAAGTVLLEEARELLAREDRLRAVARRAADGGPGTLRAGVPPGTTAAVISALLAACAADSPRLRVDLREATTGEQMRSLGSGGLDVGLVHRPVAGTGLRFGPETVFDLGVVLPRTSPRARQAQVALAELSGQDLLLFPRDDAPGWYDRLLESCRAAGFVPGEVRHASSPEFLLALVAAGHGVAFDQGHTARKEPRVVWRPLSGRPLVRRIGGAWPAGPSAHPAAARFAELAAGVLAADRTGAVRQDDGTDPPDPPDPPDSPDGPPRPWSVVFG
ncbi:LysR family transcriptional regulator [Streptomyces sp. NPDC088354]|uniref:LysR family transcriptional regulator n=1 Tax=unclassified Streptomyces TaxID=2593676 RepID=UPI0029A6BFBB|nr:LysR substrate-binding domain-containing protein [Streptomyces sp. MI02-7b]MDX3070854.1 LysR substrate-binding domain-containing protein [Streptomyces sp. MI02-7b]